MSPKDFGAHPLSPSSQKNATNYDLHQFIEMGCWSEVGEMLKQENIGDLVSVPYLHRDGDFPLHAVCDFKFDESKKHPSSSEKNVEIRQEMAFPPPPHIVLGILNAFPNATKVKGANGCLPLHNATRRGAPKEVMDALIQAFPQALDVKNDNNITPRDYIQTEDDCNILLERPTSCWLHSIAEGKNNKKLEEELKQLEKESQQLQKILSETLQKEHELHDRLAKMEMKLMRHDLFVNGNTLTKDIDSVCDEISSEIDALSKNALAVKEKFDSKYLEDGKNRSFINGFNSDVIKIHEHLDSELSDFRMELESIKKSSRLRNQ